MTQFRDMAQAVADHIREVAKLDTRISEYCRLTILVEDKLNANFVIDDALGRNGICVIVGVTGFSRKPNTGSVIFGTVNFDVSVFENPVMSREDETTPTAQMVAEFIARKLHWHKEEEWLSPLRFQSVTRADEYPCVIERLTFNLDVQL